MINEFFSDIHNAIFSPLKSWAEQSPGNWSILIGVGFLLVMGSAIFAFVMHKMIGQDDERTNNNFFEKQLLCVGGNYSM